MTEDELKNEKPATTTETETPSKEWQVWRRQINEATAIAAAAKLKDACAERLTAAKAVIAKIESKRHKEEEEEEKLYLAQREEIMVKLFDLGLDITDPKLALMTLFELDEVAARYGSEPTAIHPSYVRRGIDPRSVEAAALAFTTGKVVPVIKTRKGEGK